MSALSSPFALLTRSYYGKNRTNSRSLVLPQLLKKQTDRFNSPIEVRYMKLLIWRVQIVIGQTKAHHHAGNLQHILKIRNDRNRATGPNKYCVLMKNFVHGLGCGLDVFVVRAHYAGRSLAPDLDLGLDSLGRWL